jgi:hypothetical protein
LKPALKHGPYWKDWPRSAKEAAFAACCTLSGLKEDEKTIVYARFKAKARAGSRRHCRTSLCVHPRFAFTAVHQHANKPLEPIQTAHTHSRHRDTRTQTPTHTHPQAPPAHTPGTHTERARRTQAAVVPPRAGPSADARVYVLFDNMLRVRPCNTYAGEQAAAELARLHRHLLEGAAALGMV